MSAEPSEETIVAADVLIVTGVTLVNHTLEKIMMVARWNAEIAVIEPTASILPDVLFAVVFVWWEASGSKNRMNCWMFWPQGVPDITFSTILHLALSSRGNHNLLIAGRFSANRLLPTASTILNEMIKDELCRLILSHILRIWLSFHYLDSTSL